MTKKKVAAVKEVAEVVEEVAPETFFVVVINTGKDVDPVQLRVTDPVEAQTLATKAVEAGVYTMEIENGIRVIPVKGADVVGPLTEQAAPANDES